MTSDELIHRAYAAINGQDANMLLAFAREMSTGRTHRRDCLASSSFGPIRIGNGQQPARADEVLAIAQRCRTA